MKQLLSILALVAIFATSAFAADNTPNTNKTGTSSFGCTVITPLIVSSPEAGVLGEFVKSTDLYYFTGANAKTLIFGIAGQAGHAIICTPVADAASSADVTFNGSWGTAPTQLTGGNVTYTYTLASLMANEVKTNVTLTVGFSVVYSF
jgi:hypothetical protein